MWKISCPKVSVAISGLERLQIDIDDDKLNFECQARHFAFFKKRIESSHHTQQLKTHSFSWIHLLFFYSSSEIKFNSLTPHALHAFSLLKAMIHTSHKIKCSRKIEFSQLDFSCLLLHNFLIVLENVPTCEKNSGTLMLFLYRLKWNTQQHS